jgi:N-acetylglutamate synthase-like GNAT family acetyltransferase
MNALVETIIHPRISDADANDIATLIFISFPNPNCDEAKVRVELRQAWQGWQGPAELAPRSYVIRHAGRIVAHAAVYPREIITPRGREFAALLAAVMCHPDWKRHGYGKAVVRAAFAPVDAGDHQLSFFQTNTAKGFYEKLGCRQITNRIVNSLNREAPEANPCWDPYAMIYPDLKEWGEGTIDLLGSAV